MALESNPPQIFAYLEKPQDTLPVLGKLCKSDFTRVVHVGGVKCLVDGLFESDALQGLAVRASRDKSGLRLVQRPSAEGAHDDVDERNAEHPAPGDDVEHLGEASAPLREAHGRDKEVEPPTALDRHDLAAALQRVQRGGGSRAAAVRRASRIEIEQAALAWRSLLARRDYLPYLDELLFFVRLHVAAVDEPSGRRVLVSEA